MANEITLQWRLKAEKGGAAIDSTLQQKSVTLVGSDMTAPTQLIGYAAAEGEALALGDVGTAGYLAVKNLDATNFVELSNGSGTGAFAAGKFAKIRAGCVAFFQPVGTVYAKADTADARVQVHAVAL
jgi:hypothetical protein